MDKLKKEHVLGTALVSTTAMAELGVSGTAKSHLYEEETTQEMVGHHLNQLSFWICRFR